MCSCKPTKQLFQRKDISSSLHRAAVIWVVLQSPTSVFPSVSAALYSQLIWSCSA